jgi:hypothetical protein
MKRSSPLVRTTPLTSRLTVKPKKRKCANKACKTPFEKRSMSHVACSPACALLVAVEKREKAERRDIAVRKESIKTRTDYLKEAQIAFNAYVRARDAGQLCICCDRPLQTEAVGGGFDCGHYRSVGSAPHLRFDENNAHGQTKQCNRYGAGRAVDYRIGLIQRIGLAKVEALEADQEPRKWTVEELKAIKQNYKEKLKALKAAGTD